MTVEQYEFRRHYGGASRSAVRSRKRESPARLLCTGDTGNALYTGKPDARLFELLAAFNAACEPMARAANIAPGDQSRHKAYDAAQAQHDAVFNEICNTPATTLAGIVAKLETRHCIEMRLDQDGQPLDELNFESRAAVSVLRDARRLTIP